MNIPLLHRLRAANGAFVPLTELGTDVERVRTDLEEFEAFGFAIERHPYWGLAYRGPAERLCPDQIEFELGTRWLGRRIAVWNRVSSTNDLAAKAASSVANEGLVVLAEEQSAGRGRRGRRWMAPPRSSVLMSILLFPPATLNETGWLTALGAVAVAEVISAWSGCEARIKWPNDVRVGGRKIAGILVERGPCAVIGIGVNTNITFDQFPAELRTSATSLAVLVGERIDRSEFIRALIRRLDEWYDLGRRDGPGSLSKIWCDLSEHRGQAVRVITRVGPVSGRLDRLDFEHGIILREGDGRSRHIRMGEVIELAPGESAAVDEADAWRNENSGGTLVEPPQGD